MFFGFHRYIAVIPQPFCRSCIRFRLVNMRRNWMETTFRSDEHQAAQTSILDEANMLQEI